MRWTVVAAISVAFLLTAPQASRPKSSDPAPAARDVARYRALGHDTARSVAAIGAPLKTLTEEQMASVAALLVLTRVAAEGHLARSPEAVVLDEVWKELRDPRERRGGTAAEARGSRIRAHTSASAIPIAFAHARIRSS